MSFSLSDITRSGSLGMISARYLEHLWDDANVILKNKNPTEIEI
jgi:hypothetical protein